MIQPLVSLVLCLTPAAVVPSLQHPDAVDVFHCTFGDPQDVNHDGWPDFWTRRRDRDYPGYVPISIQPRQEHPQDQCLRIELDGGAAAVFSPPIEISSLFSYVLSVQAKTEGLFHDVAYISLVYLDQEKKPLGKVLTSSRLHRTSPWQQLRIGPLSADDPQVGWVSVGLHLEPAGKEADLRGSASFDDIRLARMPRMVLTASGADHIYHDPKEVQITCRLSGQRSPNPLVTLRLMDVYGKTLVTSKQWIDSSKVEIRSPAKDAGRAQEKSVAAENQFGYQGELIWKPPVTGNGFYRVRAVVGDGESILDERSTSFVVVDPARAGAGGEFGWSLPQGDEVHSLSWLAGVLREAGVQWVKFPVWYSEKDDGRADRLAWFAERLSLQNISLVGLLDQPPADVRKLFARGEDHLPAAVVFSDRGVWFPVLSPVMTRLSLKVHWWQLGRDDDTSFSGFPDLTEKIGTIKSEFESYGQRIHIGLAWPWVEELPHHEAPPWDFVARRSELPLTAAELEAYLGQETPSPKVQRWVTLLPLSAKDYSLQARTRDLVTRMVTAKLQGASGVFVPDPFDAETGLLRPDGTPAELFLPWRTTSTLIGGSRYLGSIVLPGGSRNHLFSRGDEVVMVMYSDQPAREVINLGDPETIRVVDVWGATRPVAVEGHRQVYEAGKLPVFVTGLSRQLAQWRLQFQFEEHRLANIYGRPQSLPANMHNPFKVGVSGVMRLNIPEMWGQPPKEVNLSVAAGEKVERTLEVTLDPNASSGVATVRVDFDISADANYRFSVWRELEVGLGDIVMEFFTHLDQQGNMIVDQQLVNRSDTPVWFRCMLYAPGRSRLRQDVMNHRQGRDRRRYIISDGKDLLGKTLWVRAEEMAGERVLNYRFVAQP